MKSLKFLVLGLLTIVLVGSVFAGVKGKKAKKVTKSTETVTSTVPAK